MEVAKGLSDAVVCAFTVPTRLQEKARSLERLLEGGEGGFLDEAKLRGITSTGVPDSGGLRPILWRYLLQCVPRFLEGIALCAVSIAAMLRDGFLFVQNAYISVGRLTIYRLTSSQSKRCCFCVANPLLATSRFVKP